MRRKDYLFPIVILCLAMLLPLSGCRTIFGFKYGMTQPREETPEELTSFLAKNQFPLHDLYQFSDSTAYFQAIRNRVFRKNMLSHMIFDRDGQLLERDTNQCQWAGYTFVRDLKRDTSYQIFPGFKVNTITDHIKPFGDHSDTIAPDPDFTIVITWAKFIGKYNQRLFVLSRAVAENKTAVIRMIYLNIDMQKSWKLTKSQKFSFQ
ncbi:MAG: hypothetical protein M0P58_03755 [Bacteroidales bacterium]|jgi:hypothetical protein|nr:hypothetical protein [Bacteroidales bacterium]